jgi:hypothetical protein
VAEPRRNDDERARPRRRGRRRLGSAIVFALSILTPVLVASGTVLSQLRSYADEVDRRVNAVTAQLVAASGAHDALARLEADLTFRGTFEVLKNGGRASVAVTQIEGEDTPDFDDDLFLVRSEGWLNGPTTEGAAPPAGVRWYRSVVTATAKPKLIDFPVAQTLGLGKPEPDVLFSGTSFRIDGDDSSGPGSPDPLPGIGVTGDPAALEAQISKTQQPLITGADGEGDASILQTVPVDLTSWIDRFHVNPEILWTSTLERLDGTQQLGTASDPTVAFAENTLQVRGNVTGYGVLVVKGDLRVTGSLDFEGLILVGGTATFNSSLSGGHTHTKGALLIGGSDVARDLSVVGNVEIRYDSSAMQQYVGRVVDGVDVVTWDHDLDAAAYDSGSGSPSLRQ